MPAATDAFGSRGLIPIRNRPDGNEVLEAGLLVSPDALAYVRFGLRAADDPRILNTVAAIDALLKRDLPAGPYWYRYNDDGYGEHADGAPFDGSGIGRLWPLLTGERAHYELAAGRPEEARRLLATFEASASAGGLLPEQIWDSEDIPERELFPGAALRKCDAAGLGARRTHQIAALVAGRRRVRHAAADLCPICDEPAKAGTDRLAYDFEDQSHGGGSNLAL